MLNFFEDTGVSLSLDADRLKVEGLKQLPPGQAQKIREKIKTHRTEIMRELSKIPAPSPPGMGHEYDDLWNKAWILADFVDGDTAPYADRKARLPELMQMRDRMAAIEWRAGPPAPTGDEVYHILDAAEKVKPGKVKRSHALEAAAAILENPDVKLNKQEQRAGMAMGKEIKLALMATPKEHRTQAVKDAAWIMELMEGGAWITKEDATGVGL
jgi:hypothetical protein